MSDEIAEKADQLLEQALESTGSRDPREFYRDRLRDLKRTNPDGYADAVSYYRDTLIPSVADSGADALQAWTEYGRRLAEALAPGRTVEVDGTGFARPYEAPSAADRLVLHIPEDKRARTMLVALPPELTLAQRATYDVLVSGKQRLRVEAPAPDR